MKVKRIFALLLCALMILSLMGCAKDTYEKAVKLMEDGSYAEALEQFKTILDYEDSAEKAAECEKNIAYNDAVDQFENGSYEEAMNAFKELGDFKDSEEKYGESAYELAKAKFDDKDYEGAREILKGLSDDNADNDEANEMLKTCSSKILKQYILDNGKAFDDLGSDFTDVTTMLDKDAYYIKKTYKNDHDDDYSLLACASKDSDSMKIIYYSATREQQDAGTVFIVSTADMPLESDSIFGVYGVMVAYLEKGADSQKVAGLVGSFYNEVDGDSKKFDITTANKDSKWTYGGLFSSLSDDDAESLTLATTENLKYVFENADDLLSDADVTLKDLGFESV